MRMTGNGRNIRNTWRRKCTAVLREMEAAATQSSRFAVGSLDAWLQAMNIGNVWCSPKLKWQEFIRMAPAVPLTLKPNDTKAFFQYGIEYFLAACRRVIHQNVVYEMLANPILAHLVAIVGAPQKSGGIRVTGAISECCEKCMESATARSGQQSSITHSLWPTIGVSGLRIGPRNRACTNFGKQAAGWGAWLSPPMAGPW